MGNLFSTKTSNTTNSNESGTANTANNLWNDPGVQSFFQQYQNQYSPSNIASVQAPVNSYETNAANAQAGAAAPAAGIANNGITSASIQQYMSPYIQSVVNPTLQAQNIQNQQGLSNLGGNAALRGALGNNTGSGAAYLAGVQPAQEATIAGLYNQGYGQAENTAAQSAQTQLAGVNAATGANTAAFNQGQGIQQTNLQNQLLPYGLTDQAATGLQNYGNLAGQNTATTGTSSGTSTGTTTPGAGTVAAGLLGTILSGFKLSDERIKDNVKPIGATFDGQPIYKYNLKGSPQTEIGLMAQDVERRDPGAVGSAGGVKSVDYDRATKGAERASGGSVGGEDEFHGKVMKAFHMIQGMKEHARRGAIHRDIGGGIDGDVGMGSWMPTVTPASSDDGPSASQKIGSGLTNFAKQMSAAPQGDGGLGKQQSALSQMLSSAAASTMPRPMRPYGGAVDDDSGDAPSWGSRAWDALGSFFHVPDSVRAGLEAYPAAAQRVMANPEGTASGLAHGVLNAFPMVGSTANLMSSAPDAIRGMASLGHPAQAAAAAAPMADDDGMTPYGPAVYGDREMAFAPPTDTAPASPAAMDEQSSITPMRETLPWKVGASDVPARPTASSGPPALSDHWWNKIPVPFSEGVWAGEQPSASQRLGAALTQIGDRNPFAGFGKAIMEYPGETAKVNLTQAEALKAAHDANLGYQIQSSNALAAAQRQQEIQRLQGLKALSKQKGWSVDTVAALTRPSSPGAFVGEDGYWYRPDPNNPGALIKGTRKQPQTGQP